MRALGWAQPRHVVHQYADGQITEDGRLITAQSGLLLWGTAREFTPQASAFVPRGTCAQPPAILSGKAVLPCATATFGLVWMGRHRPRAIACTPGFRWQ